MLFHGCLHQEWVRLLSGIGKCEFVASAAPEHSVKTDRAGNGMGGRTVRTVDGGNCRGEELITYDVARDTCDA
jgi:hypothetical protein